MAFQSTLHAQEARLAAAMRKTLEGDAKTYRELLTALQALLQLYCFRTLLRVGIQSETGSVVQVTLQTVHLKRHTYFPDQLFTPWLIALARYRLIAFGRNRYLEGFTAIADEIEEALKTPVFTEPAVAAELDVLTFQLPLPSRLLLEPVKLDGLLIAEWAARD